MRQEKGLKVPSHARDCALKWLLLLQCPPKQMGALRLQSMIYIGVSNGSFVSLVNDLN